MKRWRQWLIGCAFGLLGAACDMPGEAPETPGASAELAQIKAPCWPPNFSPPGAPVNFKAKPALTRTTPEFLLPGKTWLFWTSPTRQATEGGCPASAALEYAIWFIDNTTDEFNFVHVPASETTTQWPEHSFYEYDHGPGRTFHMLHFHIAARNAYGWGGIAAAEPVEAH